MQQLACPNCHMTVSVLAAEQMLCPGCQAEMMPVEESTDEPIVAEAENPPAMRLVELSADAPPMRPTVVVPHGPPPKWKARPVAQAWKTVAHGLDLHDVGIAIALLLLVGGMILRPMGWGDKASLELLVTNLVVGTIGILFVAGRLCCYRVPPNTGARLWMGLACAGTAISTMLSLTTSVQLFVSDEARTVPIVRVLQWTTLGLWLATEGAFLWALRRIGQFVKRPRLIHLSYGTAVALALAVGLWLLVEAYAPSRLLIVMEFVFVGLMMLYLFLLRAARNAVASKTPDE